MVLKNHIAYRFLIDDMMEEIISTFHKNEYKEVLIEMKGGPKASNESESKVASLFALISSTNNKTFIVTDSVIRNLDLLKITKKGNHFDWTVFKHLTDRKVTFILPNNTFLRMVIQDDKMHFFHNKFELQDKVKGTGHTLFVLFYLNRVTGELCEHFEHQDVKSIEEMVYKFLCFFYLTDNQEEVITPGKVHGTRKTGKTLNDFDFPVTIVTSKWNITTIRTEGFDVSGHFRVQPCGEGRANSKIIFIEPFKKNGYIRKAKSQSHE